ncbi:MAG: 4-amino-4-deoxy-L-arabinose transferase-like glycosyltransferase [Salibacteraceae bacterium]|jgi:4-amino-4-deoxy-L-arabinose transferase-like glycosyltransferase
MAVKSWINRDLDWMFVLTAILVVGFSFLGIGIDGGSQVWDEARNGMNAVALLENGDFLNLHYAGEYDNWHLKPSFYSWVLALSMKVFGANLFALRLPNTIAAIFIFYFVFRIVNLFKSRQFAFLVVLILLSVRGLLGNHVSRTADIDGVLLFTMLGGLYCFLRYTLSYSQKYIYISSLFFSLALLLKGVNVGIYIFGLLLYLFWTKKASTFFSRREVWFATMLGILFPFVVYGILLHFFDPVGSILDKALVLDIFNRFSGVKKDASDTVSIFFFFQYLDVRFNIWNYVFYLGIATVLYRLYKSYLNIKDFSRMRFNDLTKLSICIILPLSLFLTFASFQHHWYFAPVLPFIAVLTITSIYNFIIINKKVKVLFVVLLLVTLGRQAYTLFYFSPEISIIAANKELLKKSNRIIVNSENLPSSNLLLDIYFLNSQVMYSKGFSAGLPSDNVALLCRTYHTAFLNAAKNDYEVIYKDNEYVLLK